MREVLPARRLTETIKFEHRGIGHFASVSRYEDNRLAEVFLDAGKVGSDAQAYARDMAVAVSLALQAGCPATTIRDALSRNDDGSPAGPLGRLLDLMEL